MSQKSCKNTNSGSARIYPGEDVTSPYGLTVIHEDAHHYWYVDRGQRSDGIGAAIMVIDIDENVLLVESKRIPIGEYSIEVPRGGFDDHEDARTGAVRELREETGLSVTSDQLIDFGAIHPDNGILSSLVRLFGVRLDTPLTDVKDLRHCPDETVGLHIVQHAQVMELIRAGRIKDSFTIMLAHMMHPKPT